MLDRLRKEVRDANRELVRQGLVFYTFGNVSGLDRESGLVVIKPSGVDYDELTPDDMVITDLDGRIVEGDARPSSDLDTHLALYRAFPDIGGVTHTHSVCATAFAQAGRGIPCLGTTHADYCHGDIPITLPLTPEAIAGKYELETGMALVAVLEGRPALNLPGALVHGHGPFSWGKDAAESVYHAKVMEVIADMALKTLALHPDAPTLGVELMEKHFFRKHGANAYYGQPKKEGNHA